MSFHNFLKSIIPPVLLSISLFLSGCGKVDLLNNLHENDANEMMAILLEEGIPTEKLTGTEENSLKLSVDKNLFARATELLKSKGYPKVRFANIGDVFKKSGLVSSPLEERVRFMYALSESIADTLTKINGVATARVHIVLPENDPYSEKVTPSSAAVFLTYLPNSNLEDYVRDVKLLVVNSIEGLDYDKVTVAMFPAKVQELSEKNNNEPYTEILSMKISDSSMPRFWFIIGSLIIFLSISIFAAGFFFWKSHSVPK